MAPLKIFNAGQGPAKRGLVACNYYSTGDIICSFEPAVNVPLSGRLLADEDADGTIEVEQEAHLDPTTGVCAYCLETYPAQNMTICQECKLMSYCSQQCLEKDTLHAPECTDVCGPQKLIMSGFLRALYRILCMAESPRPRNTYAQLTHHTTDTTWPALDTLRLASEALVSRNASRGHSLEQILEYAGMLFINQYTRCDDLGRQAGYVFDPTLALINHSCVPNAYLLFRGRKVHLVCWKPINDGDEVFLSYTRFMHPTPERRTLLYMHFRFWCECPGCVSQELEYPYSHVVCTQCGTGVNRDPFSLLNPPPLDQCIRHLMDGVSETSASRNSVVLVPSARLLVCECENKVSGDVIQAMLTLMTYSVDYYDSPNFKQALSMVLALTCTLEGAAKKEKCQAIVEQVSQSKMLTMQLCLRLMVQAQVMPVDSHIMSYLVALRNQHQLQDTDTIPDSERLPHLQSTIAVALLESLVEMRYCRVQMSSYNPVVSIGLFMLGNYLRILALDVSKSRDDFLSDDDLQSIVNLTYALFSAANENLSFTHPASPYVQQTVICADLVRKDHDDLVLEGNLVVSKEGLNHDLSVLCGFLYEYLSHDGLLGDGSFPQTIHILDVTPEIEMVKTKLEFWYRPMPSRAAA
ncbi:N-lysine methyltransferase SMYD2 [Yarrowia sp. C11]|nr:N-lysine methyltransferase SMYD2 [Yarrowia sp. E02]KAG5371870.1 N-lysine methyltransferase SMYD2 [Yarrowia sp. C11]